MCHVLTDTCIVARCPARMALLGRRTRVCSACIGNTEGSGEDISVLLSEGRAGPPQRSVPLSVPSRLCGGGRGMSEGRQCPCS